MNEIRVVPLGAGQDVGRSCILVSIGSKNVMLDCGMHMGYNNEKKFPDFSYISKTHNIDDYLDCVIISHFHLDHCGGLPYFTEVIGYNGPIYMTHPTKAICPILLEDFRKISNDKRGDQVFFTQDMIHKCMKKVKTIYLHQVIKVDEELEIQPFYAGHVLGAAMFLIRVGKLSVLYTGDYNMTPDRHLGAAWVSRCEPNLLITESTYATTIRDSKRVREREFLDKIHNTLLNGGKVLIPVFALGRAQELCILLESYWDRMNLSFPIYFSTGMTEKANEYYKLFISWTNQKIKETFVERNMFDFKHIKPLQQGMEITNGPPMVIFATPGMLHAGQSLNIFKKLAPNEKNMVIIPGYCVAGTVGYKVQQGVKKLEFEKQTTIDVRLKVEYLSFSAHADAKGIMQLIESCRPRNVLLVHGESHKMDFLKGRIEHEYRGNGGIRNLRNCYKPANGEMVTIRCDDRMHCATPMSFVQDCLEQQQQLHSAEDGSTVSQGHDDDNEILNRIRARLCKQPGSCKPLKSAIIIKKQPNEIKLMDYQTAIATADLAESHLQFTSTVKLMSNYSLSDIMSHLIVFLKSIFNPESGHEIHSQEESFTIGRPDDPLVTILVKESTVSGNGSGGNAHEDQQVHQPTIMGSSTSSNINSGYQATNNSGLQIFDVLRVTDKPPGASSTFDTAVVVLPSRREVCIHVTYPFQNEPMGSGLYKAMYTACMERRLDFIN